MHKLFNYLLGKNDKTEINIKVTHYEPPVIVDPYSISSAWVCCTEDEFTKIYDQTKREREKIKSKFPEINLKVELWGKLNGLKINEKFNNLDSYRLYLENNSLINKSSLPLQSKNNF